MRRFFQISFIIFLIIYLIFVKDDTTKKENYSDDYKHFINAMDLDKKAVSIINSDEAFSLLKQSDIDNIIKFTKLALIDSRKISNVLLDNLHPKLKANFQKFIKSLELRNINLIEGNLEAEIKSKELHDNWISWLNKSRTKMDYSSIKSKKLNSKKIKIIRSILFGFIFSIPFGIGLWFGKQSEKSESLIPRGYFTENYGYLISVILCSFTFILLFLLFIRELKWLIIISYLSIFYFSIYFTIIIERLFYGKLSFIDKLALHANRFVMQYKDDAPILWERAVPRWWINLMSRKWEKEYTKKLANIIYTLNPADPLFSLTEFKNKMNLDKD